MPVLPLPHVPFEPIAPLTPPSPTSPLLSIRDLHVHAGATPIVEAVCLDIHAGEMVGLVGESGSGKSVTALSIVRLIPEPPMRIPQGRIDFDGRDLSALDEPALRAIRGEDIAMIFQEPMTSLNPVFTIGDQIREMLLLHRDLSVKAANARAAELLARVGIPSPETALMRYPHQLSGGQRQRVMIAIALACEPRLLIADEPTTALDVTVQAQILELIDDLRRESGMAVLLITHDLGVVSQYCDRVAVMYGGRIVEQADAGTLFAHPRHRYTEALLKTIPSANTPGARLPAIGGTVPAPGRRPPGCAFHPRCEAAIDVCRSTLPVLTDDDHQHACWNPVP
ncbi:MULTISPECIES: ABC transporter ATP-binding protein [unclassified Roseitalea]|uniref:ABC transporter ATP-binding protein n=1 Tax=unclassified Roseitalea TaxID=2639107 RepID=UPI00273E38D8|nr:MULTISPECIES: ABC transporter ATP-binding protein [unclassified Roseitalea]